MYLFINLFCNCDNVLYAYLTTRIAFLMATSIAFQITACSIATFVTISILWLKFTVWNDCLNNNKFNWLVFESRIVREAIQIWRLKILEKLVYFAAIAIVLNCCINNNIKKQYIHVIHKNISYFTSFV